MRALIIIITLLAACGDNMTAVATMLDNHAEHNIQIDAAACPAAIDGPIFDGDVWTFVEGSTPLRCPLPAESQDYVTGFLVYGWHPGAGPVVTEACLQIRELPTPAARPYDWPPCAGAVESAPGTFILLGILPDPGAGIAEDATLSLQIRGAPGDSFTGASVTVQRLRP